MPLPVRLPASPPPTPPLFLPLGLVILHVVRWGYGYGSSDHDELLPPVLHRLDPELFSRDWFVLSQTGGPTVRTAFQEGLRLLALVMPLPAAVALAYGVVLGALAWGIYRLGYALVPDRVGAALGALLAVVVLPAWTLGGNALTYPYLTPEGVAWAMAVPAVRLFVEARRLPAAVLLGLTAWMHLLVGFQTALVLGLVALWAATRDRSARQAGRAVLFGIVAAAVAAPLALPAALTAPMVAGPEPAGYSSFDVLARLRLPHHYLLTSFAKGDFIRFGIVVAAGLSAHTALERRGLLRHGSFVRRFLLVVLALCVFATFFTEAVPVLLVAMLQLFKLTVWATALLALLAGAWLATGLPERVRALAAQTLSRPVAGLAVVATAALLVTAMAASFDEPRTWLYPPAAHTASDLGRTEAWIRTRTPKDALFLVPPTNATFRMHARRSIVVNFKTMGVDLARLLAVAPMALPETGLGFQEALDRAYARNTAADWQRLARRFGAGFALVDAEATPAPPPGRPAFQSGRWAVYRLDDG